MMFDLPEPRDAFLGPEIARNVQRIASVRARMEEDALTAEVVRVLREKGYTVVPPPPPMTHEARAEAAEKAAQAHERLSTWIHEWAQGDEELGWPGDDILKDVGNCDDLAAFLMDRNVVTQVGP